MTIRALLFAAMFPVLLVLSWVYRKDKLEPEPGHLLLKLFLLGVVSAIPAILLEIVMSIPISTISRHTLWAFADTFAGVALVEELCKFVFLMIGSWRSREFNYRFDGIVYAVFVSLGFAALENILYVFQLGLGVAVSRALLSIPGHAVFAVFMGTFYSIARGRANRKEGGCVPMLALGLVTAILFHGFYDFCLTAEIPMLDYAFFAYAVLADVAAILLVRRKSKNDAPV